eukprot:GHVN01017901.1.p1 GENE.GHVN01017901.1~~GHVN01017901.1.p1  ORF type:complete len:379 (+),score=116.93 GHVN01017901.1:131-1267(+)
MKKRKSSEEVMSIIKEDTSDEVVDETDEINEMSQMNEISEISQMDEMDGDHKESEVDEEEVAQMRRAIGEAHTAGHLKNKGGDIVDEEGINEVLASIRYAVPAGLPRVPWMDTLSVTAARSLSEDAVEPGEDIRREKLFYNQTLENVLEAYRRFDTMGVPFSRPEDFFAEMFKSDNHMRKVRAHILDQQKALDIVASRRRMMSDKKFSRAVMIEKKKHKEGIRQKAQQEVEELKRQERKRGHQSSASGGAAPQLASKGDGFESTSATVTQRPRGGKPDRSQRGMKDEDSDMRPAGGRKTRKFLSEVSGVGRGEEWVGISSSASENKVPRSFKQRSVGGHQLMGGGRPVKRTGGGGGGGGRGVVRAGRGKVQKGGGRRK